MEIRELQWFVALAESEHVTSAAERRNIAQPTLSRAIARLEKRVGAGTCAIAPIAAWFAFVVL